LLYKDYGAPKQMTTVGDFKNSLVEGLFATLLNSRLDELTNSATPFTYGYSYYGGTLQEPKRISICGDVTEDKQLAALKVLVTENERAKKFGFTEGELNRAKSNF
jgi:zinc protease